MKSVVGGALKQYDTKNLCLSGGVTLNCVGITKLYDWFDFDNIYTAPAHGFKNAAEYYQKSSALDFLPNIKIPVLILNAANDSFLGPACYPFDVAKHHENIYLEVPKTGGHVGFHVTNAEHYSEVRVLDFLNSIQ